ncbi:MAG: adenylate/guanylate cyclase domain-containing protein [Proteobacteria bacterium]|nr:adenylate/guanylate cyclase domain-containing protein [Burkholderiales bacterium]
MIFAAGLWMVIYTALGIRFEILVPLGFQLVSAGTLVYFLKTGDFVGFRFAQVSLYLFVPFIMQWGMGNFVTASAVMLWALLAPIGVMVLHGPRESIPWFIAYIVLTAVSGFFDYFISYGSDYGLPMHTIAVFFVLNFAAISTIVYLLISYFVRERQRLSNELNHSHSLLLEEQGKSERLLLNILPARVAERLKRQDSVADGYADVTVIFADIVNFTGVSEELAPGDVIYLLNELFTGFDGFSAQHGIEKIKTIGDAYMAAGGLNAHTSDYTAAVGEVALQMLAFMRDRHTPNGAPLGLHIGIATGPVGAGVIGSTKFVYDLWGNTVNVASRLASNAELGQVSVDETTYKRLRGRYRFEGPAFVAAKGKGQITSYFLTGKLLTTERVPA